MMKKYAFYVCVFSIVVLLSIVHDSIADTNVSGYISSDTTWTQANSPYIATGNIIIRSGVTLTVEPGVTIKFNSGKSLQIDGTLIAKGTSEGKITFTKNLDDNWGYILFNDSSSDANYDSDENYSSGSILEYCIVEYAGSLSAENDYGTIKLNNAHPFINFCIIKNNSTTGIRAYNLSGTLKMTNNSINNNNHSISPYGYGGGICAEGGTVVISSNTISNNTTHDGGGGIYTDDSKINISNNTLSKNTVSSGQGGAIYISGGTATVLYNTIIDNTSSRDGGGIYYTNIYYTNKGTITISGNIINNNTASDGGGIFTHLSYYSSSTIDISNNSICNNTTSNTCGGIYAYYADYYISDNITITIFNNMICNNTSKYNAGIVAGIPTDISKNSITGNIANDVAVYCTNSNNKNFTYNTIAYNKLNEGTNTATIIISSKPLFNNNNILSNTTMYDLKNDNSKTSTAGNLNAKNNYWGTADDSTVQSKIYDWFEDSTKGLVDYSPFETALRTDCPISPPTGLTATSAVDQITLSWTPNSESDTKGYKVYWDTDSGYSYANSVDVGSATSYTITGLASGKYYVTVTAYDTDYNSSSDSSDTIINENQTNGNESWYAEENMVALGSVATTPAPSPKASPTPVSTPQPLPTPWPIPSPSLSPTPTPTNAGTVFGSVVDEGDYLLKDVMVSIVGTNYSDSTTTDEYGYYEFSGLAAGDYTLTYAKNGYTTQSQDISLDEGENRHIETVMMVSAQKGKIYGYVVNIRGEPIESVNLKLRNVKTKVVKSTASDADGFYEFADIDAGTYVIFAKRKGYKNTQKPVTLAEGEDEEIEIEMRRTTKRVEGMEEVE